MHTGPTVEQPEHTLSVSLSQYLRPAADVHV